MQLLKISETDWINPVSVVNVSQAEDGRVWVEMTDTGTVNAEESFRGEGQRLADLISESLSSDRQALEVQIRRAGEVVVQAIQDHGNGVESTVETVATRAEAAERSLLTAIADGIERVIQGKDGG